MKDSIDRARALLAAAQGECSCGWLGGCKVCAARVRAKKPLAALTPDLLTWAIGTVEGPLAAARKEIVEGCEDCFHPIVVEVDRALAEFKKLFGTAEAQEE